MGHFPFFFFFLLFVSKFSPWLMYFFFILRRHLNKTMYGLSLLSKCGT